MLNAGKLNKQVTIEESMAGSPAVDEYGEPNIVWESLATVWAAVEPLSGREFWAQQQIQSEITVRIRIRYRTDVEAGMRVSYNSKYYVVQSIIDPLEQHVELHLMCSQGVRNG